MKLFIRLPENDTPWCMDNCSRWQSCVCINFDDNIPFSVGSNTRTLITPTGLWPPPYNYRGLNGPTESSQTFPLIRCFYLVFIMILYNKTWCNLRYPWRGSDYSDSTRAPSSRHTLFAPTAYALLPPASEGSLWTASPHVHCKNYIRLSPYVLHSDKSSQRSHPDGICGDWSRSPLMILKSNDTLFRPTLWWWKPRYFFFCCCCSSVFSGQWNGS